MFHATRKELCQVIVVMIAMRDKWLCTRNKYELLLFMKRFVCNLLLASSHSPWCLCLCVQVPVPQERHAWELLCSSWTCIGIVTISLRFISYIIPFNTLWSHLPYYSWHLWETQVPTCRLTTTRASLAISQQARVYMSSYGFYGVNRRLKPIFVWSASALCTSHSGAFSSPGVWRAYRRNILYLS